MTDDPTTELIKEVQQKMKDDPGLDAIGELAYQMSRDWVQYLVSEQLKHLERQCPPGPDCFSVRALVVLRAMDRSQLAGIVIMAIQMLGENLYEQAKQMLDKEEKRG